MKLIEGLLDYGKPWTMPDVYLFTGNSTVKKNGAIVMGRGAARQVRDTYPGIDESFGLILKAKPLKHIAWTSLLNEQHIGWFKVKDHWAEAAKIELIQASTERLRVLATKKPNITFHMNYPGIGNGRLSIADVSIVLSLLPDNVRIYK